MKAHPYLNFRNNTEAAFEFYKSVFGGEFDAKQRFKDVPPGEPGFDPSTMSPEEANKIMHISLPVGEDLVLMGSDVPQMMEDGHASGNNINISLVPDSLAEAEKLFRALAEGGKITMEFEKMFWGDHFGSLVDKFGIPWMVSYNEAGEGG